MEGGSNGRGRSSGSVRVIGVDDMVETQVILSHPVLFGMQSSLSSIGL